MSSFSKLFVVVLLCMIAKPSLTWATESSSKFLVLPHTSIPVGFNVMDTAFDEKGYMILLKNSDNASLIVSEHDNDAYKKLLNGLEILRKGKQKRSEKIKDITYQNMPCVIYKVIESGEPNVHFLLLDDNKKTFMIQAVDGNNYNVSSELLEKVLAGLIRVPLK